MPAFNDNGTLTQLGVMCGVLGTSLSLALLCRLGVKGQSRSAAAAAAATTVTCESLDILTPNAF